MISPRKISRNLRGLALPMTIIAVAGLALLLVGLLTVLTLERKTARSYSDAARADLAVESGLAVALGTLSEIAKRDDSVVFRVEDPIQPTVTVDTDVRPLGFREQFFTYGAVYENGNWRGLPLFSGSQEIGLGPDRINAAPLEAVLRNHIPETHDLGRLDEHDQNIPRAKWVDVPATDPKGYDMRYAFWIEDLSGRIDARHAGSEPVDRRLSTAELDMTTILEPGSSKGGVPEAMDKKRDELRTSASVRPILSAGEAKLIEPYIDYYAPDTYVLPQAVVPQGFGYPDAGKPAPDLNAFVDSKDVTGIADQIDRNLPQLKNRRGGFLATDDYVHTIAASIIDYADTDSNPTVDTDPATPSYRGVDSYPFVNELFDRYTWIGGTANSVRIKVETFVELWNPSNQGITGVVFFVNENKHEISVPPNGPQKFTDSGTFVKAGANIPANGFLVLNLGSTEYNFPASSSFPPSGLEFPRPTTESNFKLRWNGRIVDIARGGLQRTDGTLKFGDNNRKWKGNSSPALDYSIGQSGDPRSSYYVNTWVFANNYDANSNWGGRCLKRGISNTNYNKVRIQDWADSGSNSTPGTKASDGTLPTAVALPANQPDLAPAFISNAGRYHSLGELGNIFDPAQLTNVNSTSPVGNASAGGGFTLAIGRPEFGAFDREGRRSAQLLDLFSIKPEISASSRVGRPVNINTAPREVLRTLVAGVDLDADPAVSNVLPPSVDKTGDVFADYVIAQRKVHPLRGPVGLEQHPQESCLAEKPFQPERHHFFWFPRYLPCHCRAAQGMGRRGARGTPTQNTQPRHLHIEDLPHRRRGRGPQPERRGNRTRDTGIPLFRGTGARPSDRSAHPRLERLSSTHHHQAL